MNNILSERPLPASCAQEYTGIAFDGCRYYLTMRCRGEIIILDACFQEIKCMEVCRPYTAICYDPQEHCFWAISDTCYSSIFKLDFCLQEIDCISVRVKCCPVVLTGISYCCGNHCLLATTANCILRIDKHCGDATVLLSDPQNLVLTRIVCAYPLILCYTTKKCRQTLLIMACDGTILEEIDSPKDFWIESAVLCPCKDHSGHYHLYQLASKHCRYPYLLDLCLSRCISEQISCCNRELCTPPDCCTEKRCCCNILESIALEEASIAHILNAEGEKLQKVIAGSPDICELLAVNESVQKTIVHATHLEQVLFAKLETLKKLGCVCEEPKCSSGNHCHPCNPNSAE